LQTALANVISKYNLEKKMHKTSLRKVGESVMLVVPRAVLNVLRLQPGEKMGIAVERGRLVLEPQRRPHYTLDELLAQCNRKARRRRQDEQQWLESKPVGNELL
jgi:antitoxin ChpS